MIMLDVVHAEDGQVTVRPIAETTFSSFLTYNPGWLAEVTCLSEAELPSRSVVSCGEGSQGGDGFIALCDQSGALIYCVFSTTSNPFTNLVLSEQNTTVHAFTSSGVEWSFELGTPWQIETHAARTPS